MKYCYVNQSFMYHCYLQENFAKFPRESFMLFSSLNLNVKEKEKRESNFTLLLIVLTQMIFCQVLTCPKRYIAACLLIEHHAPR